MKLRLLNRWSLAIVLIVAAPVRSESSRWPSSWDAAWVFSETAQGCQLERPIPDYGRARFSGQKWSQISFELKPSRDFGSGPISVHRHAPDWHPASGHPQLRLTTLDHLPGAGASSGADSAADMLLALRDGYDLMLTSEARFEAPTALKVHLYAHGVRPALADFLRCAASDVPTAWAEVSRSRVTYPTDGFEIRAEDGDRLRTLAAYIAADSAVKRVFIDGHTDASGTPRRNAKLSERRARKVAERLDALGVSGVEVIVRYHGAAYPVADNATVAGRALNRRTTIRLERDGGVEVAQRDQ